MDEELTYSFSAIDPWWHWHETLSVFEAAALVCGNEPNEVKIRRDDTFFTRAYPRISVVNSVIEKALRKGKITGTHVELPDIDWNGNIVGYLPNTTDLDASDVDRDSLVQWLRAKGVTTGFFFPNVTTDTPGYLDPKHNRYAPKLAAAVKAWEAMDDVNLMRGKSPLQALENWIESRYKEFSLIHPIDNEKNKTKVGDINKSAVADAAKVANWSIGGAPKTPVGA